MSIWLVMTTADGGERTFPLQSKRTVIGKESRCDVRVAIPSVDDRHCEILFDGSELRLQDLGSRSGTLHNGSRVNRAVLSHDDMLTIGPVTFRIRVQGAAAPRAATAMPEVEILHPPSRCADEAQRPRP
jgi:pSer/pThr/pTyr-binding forkhead associated (FHA) protein